MIRMVTVKVNDRVVEHVLVIHLVEDLGELDVNVATVFSSELVSAHNFVDYELSLVRISFPELVHVLETHAYEKLESSDVKQKCVSYLRDLYRGNSSS